MPPLSPWGARTLTLACVLIGWGAACSAEDPGNANDAPFAIPSDANGGRNGRADADPRVDALDINVTGDQVSVNLEDALLGDVLARLARDSGIVFRISEEMAGHRLNERFSGLTVEQALRRLLKNTNYALTHDRGVEGGPIIEVFVLEPGNTSPPAKPPPARLSDADPRAMLDALKPGSLPDDVRSALVAAAAHEDQVQVPEQDLAALRAEALATLLERMESAGGETEASRLIRERIKQTRIPGGAPDPTD